MWPIPGIGRTTSHAYDANGNLTSAGSAAGFVWNAENRLVSASKNGVTESYAYDADGSRVKKTSGSIVTRTFFPHYEEEQVTYWPYTTTAIKHYRFNGAQGAPRIAISKGGVLSYIHSDQLGSSSVETNSSGVSTAARTYYAYGSTRSSSGILQTDRTPSTALRASEHRPEAGRHRADDPHHPLAVYG